MAKPKHRDGIVYSTDPQFAYTTNQPEEAQTLPPGRQTLRVLLDKKGRAGKQVTLVSGFTGTAADLETLAKHLKTKCGTGGSAGGGEILIQGDVREKVKQALAAAGYKVK